MDALDTQTHLTTETVAGPPAAHLRPRDTLSSPQ